MLGSNASIVIDSDLSRWFRSVWAVHNKLHPADPTAEASNYGHSILPLMLMHHGAYDTMQKKPKKHRFLFYSWSSCSHVTIRCSTSLGLNSYRTQCPSFWIIPNPFKRFKTVVWSTPNDSVSLACTWREYSWSNGSKSSLSNILGAP